VMIREIAGRQNHSVKLARKLQRKNHRRDRGLLVGEGMDLLLAAAAGGAEVREILLRRELVAQLPERLLEGPAVIGICDQETLDYASSLGGAADVIFVCVQPVHHLHEVDLERDVVFFLDRVGDPGNVGTLVRSALAFGLGGVVCSPGTADPYSPKALRAGMGAQFALPLVPEVAPEHILAKIASLEGSGHRAPRIVVAEPAGGHNPDGMSTAGGLLVVLGSERSGPAASWEGAQRVTIPQRRFDSLNVAMAGTVLAYVLSRERQAGPRSESDEQKPEAEGC
jgi:TrmH family RNA methyltransferase